MISLDDESIKIGRLANERLLISGGFRRDQNQLHFNGQLQTGEMLSFK